MCTLLKNLFTCVSLRETIDKDQDVNAELRSIYMMHSEKVHMKENFE